MEYDIEQIVYLKSYLKPIWTWNKKKTEKISKLDEKGKEIMYAQTVGVIAIGARLEAGTLVYDVAGSICSPKDIFCKKQGKMIALNRLRSDNEKTRKITCINITCGIFNIAESLHLQYAFAEHDVNVLKADEQLKNIADFMKKRTG